MTVTTGVRPVGSLSDRAPYLAAGMADPAPPETMSNMNCPSWRAARSGGRVSHGDRRESFERAPVTGTDFIQHAPAVLPPPVLIGPVRVRPCGYSARSTDA